MAPLPVADFDTVSVPLTNVTSQPPLVQLPSAHALDTVRHSRAMIENNFFFIF
jgi:hypothetical protein